MNSEKDPEILEGEVVGSTPAKKAPPKNSAPPEFKIFALGIQKLKRNCLFASLAFFASLAAAIYFKNGWFVLLAFLLPPWIFAQKKF